MTRIRIGLGAAILLLVLAAAAALSLLLGQSRRHDALLMEYQASRALNRHIERWAAGSLLPLEEDVRGFGIYTEEGQALAVWGTAPAGLTGLAGTPRGMDANPIPGVLPAGTEITMRDGSSVTVLRSGGAGLGSGFRSGPEPEGSVGGRRLWYLDYSVQNLLWERRLRDGLLGMLMLVVVAMVWMVIRLTATVQRSRERMQRNEALAQLGAAARTITHEIRNPMAAVRLQTALLRRSPGGESEQGAAAITAIEQEVERMNALAENVRSFLGDPRGRPEPLQVSDAVRALSGRQPVPIRVTVPDDVENLQLYVDRIRFESIIVNLLTNAVQAEADDAQTDAAGTQVEVHLGRTPEGEAQIDVLDRGPGVPRSIRRRLFDPFFTTRDTGTGIGLATVRAFVLAAGGRVHVSDRPGGGACFRVVLPAYSEEVVTP